MFVFHELLIIDFKFKFHLFIFQKCFYGANNSLGFLHPGPGNNTSILFTIDRIFIIKQFSLKPFSPQFEAK